MFSRKFFIIRMSTYCIFFLLNCYYITHKSIVTLIIHRESTRVILKISREK